MDFIASAMGPEKQPDTAYFYLFYKNSLIVEKNNPVTIPCLTLKQAADLPMGEAFFFGTYKTIPCYCAELVSDNCTADYSRISLRAFYLQAQDISRQMAAHARGVMDLHINFLFCGKCAAPTIPDQGEHARICPSCDLHFYPRVSPAVIMAVTREDEILLARGVNFPDTNMFSVLAGFVSPAETLEACVKREVFEETRIEVKNLRYVKSQPWPFPDSLMIGFTAEYAAGDIVIDPKEILEARWFRADNLPKTPASFSLAGQLINDFIQAQIPGR